MCTWCIQFLQRWEEGGPGVRDSCKSACGWWKLNFKRNKQSWQLNIFCSTKELILLGEWTTRLILPGEWRLIWTVHLKKKSRLHIMDTGAYSYLFSEGSGCSESKQFTSLNIYFLFFLSFSMLMTTLFLYFHVIFAINTRIKIILIVVYFNFVTSFNYLYVHVSMYASI